MVNVLFLLPLILGIGLYLTGWTISGIVLGSVGALFVGQMLLDFLADKAFGMNKDD